MLPKHQRLNLKKDFKWVSSGEKLDTKYLKLFVKAGDNECPKVGVATSSNIFKKAHERNRAKRIIFAAFRSLYARLPNHTNMIALPKAGILEVKSSNVLLDLEEKLKDEKIIA